MYFLLAFRYCRLDYTRALAAIAAAFPTEMLRKTYVQGRTVGHILWCAAAPDKVAWQWNALIVRRALPHAWMTMLPSGTASNESLHAELNNWWRNAPEQFSTTLDLHLQVGFFRQAACTQCSSVHTHSASGRTGPSASIGIVWNFI